MNNTAWKFSQKFHFTAHIAESGLDCSVIQPCGVDTGVPSLCQPQASNTKATLENVERVCVFMRARAGGWVEGHIS